jgi:hypothetical protein
MIMIPHFLSHLLSLLLYPPDDTTMFQSPYPFSAYGLQLDRSSTLTRFSSGRSQANPTLVGPYLSVLPGKELTNVEVRGQRLTRTLISGGYFYNRTRNMLTEYSLRLLIFNNRLPFNIWAWLLYKHL